MSKASMHPVPKRLIVIRGLRSIGQGAMVVDLTLYLKALHWSGAAIGAVTSAAGLFGAVLIMVVGLASDRIGRRPFLIVYEGLVMVAAIATALTSAGIVLALAIIVAGFGRGQSGAAGPFSPAEQAWLARHVQRADRGRVFSVNNAAGFMGMAFGAVIGGLPALLHGATALVDYRPVFILVGILSCVCCLLILATPEAPRTETAGSENRVETQPTAAPTQASERIPRADFVQAEITNIRKLENRAMLQFALVNTLNGLAVGLTGPMMVYWFSIRFGASSAEIGITLAVGFVLTGLMSIFNGWLATRYGMVRTVTGMRYFGSSLMLLLPLLPTFWSASGLYAIRSAVNRGTQGNRSALSASLVRDSRRGFAISLNALSMRLPSAVGPALSGVLFDAGLVNVPLFLTAGLQLLNAWLYQRLFGRYDHS